MIVYLNFNNYNALNAERCLNGAARIWGNHTYVGRDDVQKVLVFVFGFEKIVSNRPKNSSVQCQKLQLLSLQLAIKS